MKYSIIVFRHGAVRAKKDFLVGWINLPLSEGAERDAQKLSQKLRREKIDVAFCSDLLRSKQALAAVLVHHPHALVIVDHRLRERHWGRGSSPQFSKNNSPKSSRAARAGYYAAVKGGENLPAVGERVFPFMNDVIRFMQKERANVAISAHPDSLNLIREYLEGLDAYEAARLNQSPTEYKKYVVEFG